MLWSVIAVTTLFSCIAAGKRPCRIEDLDGNVLREGRCWEDSECSIGPIVKTWHGETKHVFLCNPPAEKRQMMLDHACRIISDGVEIIPEDNECENEEDCIMGPYEADQGGSTVQFYKCFRHRRDRRRHHGSRHCRVEDLQGNVIQQGQCPEGPDKCTEGPREVPFRGSTFRVYRCACEGGPCRTMQGAGSDESQESNEDDSHEHHGHGHHGHHHGHGRYHGRGGRGRGRGRYGNRGGWDEERMRRYRGHMEDPMEEPSLGVH